MMERRRFVKWLATTPLALILAEMGCKQDQHAAPAAGSNIDATKRTTDAKKTLNVFVHGMFAIVLDETQSPAVAVLKAPHVGGGYHKYQARTFTINPSDQNDLVPGWTYQCPQKGQQDFVNFQGGTSKIPAGIGIGKKDHIAIDVGRLKPGLAPHWTVTLPMPDKICGLRATPFNYFSKKTTLTQSRTYANNDMTPDQQMPLIYVLSYQNIDPSQLVKLNGDDNLKIDFGSKGIGRLHLYAEPDAPPAPGTTCHVNMAIDQLNLLFKAPLDLQFFAICDPTFGVKPNSQLPCTMNNSIVLCDERSLDEINTKCSELLNNGSLEEQFEKVIELEPRSPITSAVEEQQQKGLAKRTIGTRTLSFQKLWAALPNSKPPHNCTAVLCLKRE